jgi:hypothetical protein
VNPNPNFLEKEKKKKIKDTDWLEVWKRKEEDCLEALVGNIS